MIPFRHDTRCYSTLGHNSKVPVTRTIHLGSTAAQRDNSCLSDVIRAIYLVVIVSACDLHLHKLVIDSLKSLAIPLYLSEGAN